MNQNTIEELLSSLGQFEAMIDKAEISSKKKYFDGETQALKDIRLFLNGLISKIAGTLRTSIKHPTFEKGYQIALSASFIRTHFLLHRLLFEGHGVEAMTLCRKNLENLTRIYELDKNTIIKLSKKTPNVRNILGNLGKFLYPTLSEIAHFGTMDISALLSTKIESGIHSVSIYPNYEAEFQNLINADIVISLRFLAWLILFCELNLDYNPKEDMEILYVLGNMCIEEKILVLSKA
ncbi:hypothetical protein [Flavobacterium subsaxonicum]|nr:hypothetical protein [Flavobacterium subsaxonicum]